MAFETIKNNICPYCNKEIIGNNGVFYNHLRWCKENPNYENNYKQYKLNINKTLQEKHNNLFKNYNVICKVCKKEFNIYCSENNFNKGNYKQTCSSKCAHKLSTLNSDNEKRKENIKKAIDEFNIKNGSKQIEQIKKCKYCNNEYKTLRNSTFCSIKCARLYKSTEQMKNKEPFERYKKLCEFKFGIINFPDEFNFNIIKENGWYEAANRGNNLNGVSRDHMYSCKEGFNNLIDPYLISHPANCNLILQSSNASKHSKCSISYNELINKVINWNNKYGLYENKINYNLISDLNIIKWAG